MGRSTWLLSGRLSRPPHAKHLRRCREFREAAREAAEIERARTFAELAKEVPQQQLIRAVGEERERVKQQDRVVSLVFYVKQSAKDEWRLARKLASRRAKRMLTEGEAFTLVTSDYVTRWDKDDLSGRKRPNGRDGPFGDQVAEDAPAWMTLSRASDDAPDRPSAWRCRPEVAAFT